jgi:hypothetical protein
VERIPSTERLFVLREARAKKNAAKKFRAALWTGETADDLDLRVRVEKLELV